MTDQQTSTESPVRLFVPLTDEWWEPHPTDVDRYRTVEPCTETCHHPVHAFGHPERLQHTEEAAWIIRNADLSRDPASPTATADDSVSADAARWIPGKG